MSFSAGLRITDLNDFITPALECIKPVKIEKSSNKPSKIIISDGSYIGVTETGERYKLEKAEISLNDCLACSGCVTSAETILISEQSSDEFFKKIKLLKENNSDSLVIVSLSPQSKASLSNRFKLGDAHQTHQKLKRFLHTLSVDVVLDTTFGREFSLMETARDLKENLTLNNRRGPLVASACPGWVCYAEKHRENELLVPLISRAKSPQQMMGYLVKHYLPERLETYRNTKILHATIMPCFDKKLEASRDEFAFMTTGERERDVDIVLSTVEIESLVLEKNYDFHSAGLGDSKIHEIEEMFSCKDANCKTIIYSHEGTGSGGYLEFSLRFCAKELYGMDLKTVLENDKRVQSKILKNSDSKVVTLHSDTGETLLTLCYAYGFRNIQNIIQKVRQKKCIYQFVEVMACPSGCLNGGGQIKVDDKAEQKILLKEVTDIYQSPIKQQPLVNIVASQIYDELHDKSILNTTYNVIKKIDIINPAYSKW